MIYVNCFPALHILTGAEIKPNTAQEFVAGDSIVIPDRQL